MTDIIKVKRNGLNIRLIALWLVVIISLDGLGLGMGKDFLSIQFAGQHSIFQLIVLLIIVLSLFVNHDKIFCRENPLTLPTFLVFSLFIISILTGIYEILFKSTFNFADLIKNLITVHIYLYFFSIIFLIKNKYELKTFFNGLIVLSVISAIIIIIQVVFGVSTEGNTISYGTTGGFHEYRIYSTSAILVTFGFFLSLQGLFFSMNNKLKYILISIILALGILIQLHRSVIISFLISLIVYIIFLPSLNLFKKVKFLPFLVLLLLPFVYFLSFTTINFNYLIYSAIGSTEEFSMNEGNLWLRLNTLINTISDVWRNYPLFGRGFNWEPLDFFSYMLYSFAKTPTFDNSYANIILVFGFLGLVVYSFFCFRLFRLGIQIIKQEKATYFESITYSLLVMIFYMIITGITADHVIVSPDSIITIIIWAGLFLLFKFLIIDEEKFKYA